MKFKKWVETQGGAGALALKLDVDRHRIYPWLNGIASPNVRVLQQLVKLSHGKLSYDDVINETQRNVKPLKRGAKR